MNLRYDHGLGKGGTLIYLGCALWQCSAREVLQKLEDMPAWKVPVYALSSVSDSPTGFRIISVLPLTDERLLAYAESRRIDRSIL